MMATLPQCQSGVATPPEVKAAIIRLYLGGMKRREIMKALGCGKSTISKVLNDYRVPMRGQTLLAVPGERVEAVSKLWKAGKTNTQIGLELGITRNAVAGIIHRHKITRDGSVSKANALRASRENGHKMGPANFAKGRVAGIKRPRAASSPQPAAFKIGSSNGHVYKMPAPRDLPTFTGATPHSTPKPWTERLPGECTWPVSGEGADTFSCCAPIVPGTSWCEGHCHTGHNRWRSAKGGYHAEPKSFVAELVRRFAA